jgi:hypothetical protein
MQGRSAELAVICFPSYDAKSGDQTQVEDCSLSVAKLKMNNSASCLILWHASRTMPLISRLHKYKIVFAVKLRSFGKLNRCVEL